jgi:predicted nucleic acid-binding protein
MKDKNTILSCFIDSNIWLYAFIEAQEKDKSAIAKSIITNESYSILISSQIINEVCINLIRKADFSEDSIRMLIDNFYKKYEVIDIENRILVNASKLRENHSFSFLDSIVMSCACYAKADILYSEDMQNNFRIENTKIVNPFS